MRARSAVVLALLGFGWLPALGAAAQSEDVGAGKRFRVVLNGAFAPSSLGFEESRRYTEFVETATLEARYEDDPGTGFDGGVQFNFAGRFGLLASYSQLSRSGGGSFQAQLPHPLFFNQFRSAEGGFDGYDYKESAFHVDLAAGAAKGPFELVGFAGVSFFDVEADLVDTVQYSHVYPYDRVTVTGVPKKRLSQKPTGFNVGARADYGFGRSKNVGLGLQLRYSHASAELSATESNSVKLDVGGLQVALGLRFFF